jgi:hypothetical protein
MIEVSLVVAGGLRRARYSGAKRRTRFGAMGRCLRHDRVFVLHRIIPMEFANVARSIGDRLMAMTGSSGSADGEQARS